MYLTYLRRELSGRKKQTVIVAAGLAIAIALVLIVNSLAAGVRDAQAAALQSVYGVGTDVTVTGAQSQPGDGPRFQFGEDGGTQNDDGSTSLSQSMLMPDRMRGTLEAATVDAVADLDGVAAASGALSLTNTTFDGELPQRPAEGEQPDTDVQPGESPQGGQGGGFGGGDFGVDSFSVLGITAADDAIGPMSSVEAAEGRLLDAEDEGANVAVIDQTYATTNELAVGGTIDVGGNELEIVGIAASTSAEADTAADVYIPLDVAQTLSGSEDAVSTIYVQAASSEDIEAVQAAIQAELPDATVSTQSDLASTVSGSLASATSLITNLGTWLSIIVLAVAVLLAVLFTISGVTRRTREFGTLKAIGWSNGRVVGQVAGEAVVQGLIGGAAGLVLGLAGVLVINLVHPVISAAPAASSGQDGAPGGGFGGGPFGGSSQAVADIALSAPVSVTVILAAIGLAIAGGLVAGAIGGWRAARLSPAEALRSVA
ncbi:ABC transporter permease [Microbacterium stercoris]|uniref:ABC transporter permease n=1 Tax=Microbacterium stercoris TaxID=2820289 RepID=A0A939QFV6_9MICO|nr:ABC transporter permease [Microbacterium stercoris]MBO3662179.1 ABC transporter permease [Microbacterium stercoris]